MGSDDLFKKRHAERRKKEHDFKETKPDSFLIVTEGTRTEPNYFSGLKRRIEEKYGSTVDIQEMPEIDIRGEGMATERLIEAADIYVSQGKVMYQNVWLVFDKDDFPDFDEAIEEGHKRGYRVAWSNQSFEYWLFLHFSYSDSDLHRHEWIKKLGELFNAYGLSKNGYSKNMEDLYDKLDSICGVETAIGNAKRRMAGFVEGRDKPSEYSPGTMVHILVEQLHSYLKEICNGS
ncbi:MAG: RloB family protein [Lachnospiraceae bacterium]|nr:RloB family protein [Lachnospiraceae bacterium]